MAKRFTDSKKWDKAWFMGLAPKIKLLWQYLCDNCDNAGIWDMNFPLASLQIGTKVNEQDLSELGAKVVHVGDNKIFVRGFVEFQYNISEDNPLNPDNKAHLSVIRTLQKYGIESPLEGPCLGLTSPSKSLPGVGVRVGIGLGEEKGGVGENNPDAAPPKITRAQIESVYKKYPRKLGKTEGIKKLMREIATPEDLESLSKAIDRFISHHKSAGTEPKYLPFFSTFVTSWKDWLDEDTGSVFAFASHKSNKREMTQEEKEAFAEQDRIRKELGLA